MKAHPPHYLPLLSIALFVGLLAGCGDETGSAVTVVDSAGVRITTNPPIASTRLSLTLNSPPVVVLGGLRDDLAEEFLSRSPWMTP